MIAVPIRKNINAGYTGSNIALMNCYAAHLLNSGIPKDALHPDMQCPCGSGLRLAACMKRENDALRPTNAENDAPRVTNDDLPGGWPGVPIEIEGRLTCPFCDHIFDDNRPKTVRRHFYNKTKNPKACEPALRALTGGAASE